MRLFRCNTEGGLRKEKYHETDKLDGSRPGRAGGGRGRGRRGLRQGKGEGGSSSGRPERTRPQRLVVRRARRTGSHMRPVQPRVRRRVPEEGRLVPGTQTPGIAVLHLQPGAEGEVRRAVPDEVRHGAAAARGRDSEEG